MKCRTYCHGRSIDEVRELIEREDQLWAREYNVATRWSGDTLIGERPRRPKATLELTIAPETLKLTVKATFFEAKIFKIIDARIRQLIEEVSDSAMAS